MPVIYDRRWPWLSGLSVDDLPHPAMSAGGVLTEGIVVISALSETVDVFRDLRWECMPFCTPSIIQSVAADMV